MWPYINKLTIHSLRNIKISPTKLSILRPSLTDRVIKSFNRLPGNIGSKRHLNYLKHAFSLEEAIKRFHAADSSRIFAPIVSKENALEISQGNPLKKVLIPSFGITASISYTTYEGEHGEVNSRTTYDENGNSSTETWEDWEDISGVLSEIKYTLADHGMTIYGGFTWNSKSVESALEAYSINKFLPFDAASIDKDVSIDPFLVRTAIAQEKANERVHSAERRRIHADIERRTGHSLTKIRKFTVYYQDFKMTDHMLPAYVLQYPGYPERILPAISKEDKVIFGPNRFSVTKCMAASAATTSLLSIFFPQFAIPMRLAFIAASSTLTGIWAKYQGGHLRHRFDQRRISKDKENNETVSETIADKDRVSATSRDFSTLDETTVLNFDESFYRTLGLDPKKPVTKDDVAKAFAEKIKSNHPDQGGNSEETRDLLKARQLFNEKYYEKYSDARNKGNKKEPTGRRKFSTFYKPSFIPAPVVKVKNPPRSVPHPNTDLLIREVIDNQNYKNALELVRSGQALPDGHDAGENTLLTECVKRGTLEDVIFAIDTLGASVDTSCDCPVHNTGLHYAAESGDTQKAEAILKRKASVNLINSQGKTALDVAHEKNDEKMQKLLIGYGAKQYITDGTASSLLAKIKGKTIGFGSNDRTLLIEQLIRQNAQRVEQQDMKQVEEPKKNKM